jgi:M6 family metalloprotease-like protein
VLGWFTADKPAEHYWDNSNRDDTRHDNDAPEYHQQKYRDGWLSGHAEKWAEAIRKAAREFNFAAYDSNHDGAITPEELAILVVIPQQNADGFVRDVVAREWPQTEPLVVNGVRLTRISEWYTGQPPILGTAAHELTHHLLKTPDMYFDVPWPYAPGAYSIMDQSYRTSHLDPFCKLKLGWLQYGVAMESGEYSLLGVENSRQALILYSGRRGPAEYFLLENRWRNRSYDAGAGGAGAGIPQDGLAVWHILEDPALYPRVNAPANTPLDWARRGVRLIRANGGTPFDDSHALFGLSMTLSDSTSPANLRWLDGSPSGFEVALITPPGPQVRLRIRTSR